MKVDNLQAVINEIFIVVENNKDYLISLDQQNGDGDLGISMYGGFRAVTDYLDKCGEDDWGRVLNKCGDVFNEAAPSSLGTILAFGMKGMGRSLKGTTECDLKTFALALRKGIESIMDKTGSKPGEKTILDSLWPAVDALEAAGDKNVAKAMEAALAQARAGSERTRDMKAVWGRAAYYGEKSLGIIDGGSVVGVLIFEGLNNYFRSYGKEQTCTKR